METAQTTYKNKIHRFHIAFCSIPAQIAQILLKTTQGCSKQKNWRFSAPVYQIELHSN
jgi:hypothetical protein